MTITLSADELADRIMAGHPQLILASLWKPHDGGYVQYESEHIPTARFCDPALVLASVPSSSSGRNPLPSKSNLDWWFKRWGLTHDRDVIVYDDNRGLFAARAWWILKWAGVERVYILDGGQGAWTSAGYKLIGGPGNPRLLEGEEANLGHMPTATINDVKAFDGLLIDAREANRFVGRKEFLDLKAGHIPGAINIPTREVLNPDYTFKSPEELREIFTSHGVTKHNVKNAIVYSGSGNHSAQVIAAMNIAGIGTPRHYIGGWSQWCANPRNPVNRGF